jgi:hypothetical protein
VKRRWLFQHPGGSIARCLAPSAHQRAVHTVGSRSVPPPTLCGKSLLPPPRMSLSPCIGVQNLLHEPYPTYLQQVTPIQSSAWTKSLSGRLQRCGQPGQQHGRRMPLRILSIPTSMRRFLVSAFLADVTQQIHSFRAKGVISAQRLLAAALDAMALRKSGGSLWTVPPAIFWVIIHQSNRACFAQRRS